MKKYATYFLVFAMALVVTACCKEESPKYTCNELFPAPDAVNVPLPLNFAWCAKSDAAKYRLMVSKSSSFGTFEVDTLITANRYLPNTDINASINSQRHLSFTKYYWKVGYVDTNGNTTSETPVFSFKTVDVRDSIIGEYRNVRRRAFVSSNGGITYRDAGVVNFTVGKRTQDEGISFKDNDFPSPVIKEFDISIPDRFAYTSLYWFRHNYNGNTSGAIFKIDRDSFNIFIFTTGYGPNNPGYVYSGRRP